MPFSVSFSPQPPLSVCLSISHSLFLCFSLSLPLSPTSPSLLLPLSAWQSAFAYQSVRLAVGLLVCLRLPLRFSPLSLPFCLCTYLCPFVFMCVCLFVCLCQKICLSFCSSVCLVFELISCKLLNLCTASPIS